MPRTVITSATLAPTIVENLGTGGAAIYATAALLPLSNNTAGEMAFVSENNRLYMWNGSGWYNIALINTSPSITGGYFSSYKFETNGTPIEITLIGSDPEGIPLTWSYEVTTGSLTNGGGTTATINQVGNVFTLTPTTNTDYGGQFSITWKASDGVNLGTAVSSFTLIFTIADSKYTTLLLKSSTTGNNTTFVDNSTVGRTFTPSGDVVQESFSPHSRPQGEWSVYFDGSGDYLSVPDDTQLDFDTGDFTIEAWWYPSTLGANQMILDKWASGDAAGWQLYYRLTGTSLAFYAGGTVVLQDPVTTRIVANTWHHISVVRSGTTVTMYINGVSVDSATFSSTLTNARTLYVGAQGTTGTNFITGYLSNIRLVKDSALYTANFTVPTVPLVPVTNTSLLTCQDRNFKDNSSNDFAITTAGNASISAFGPFNVSDVYDKAVHGGSGYFDGTGDVLNMSSNVDIATGPFSIEAWLYVNSLSSAMDILSNRYWYQGNNGGYELLIQTNGTITLSASPGTWNSWPTIISSTTAIKTNEWNHIAICRDSSDVMTVYLNGVADNTVTYSASLNLGDAHTTRVGYVILDNNAYNYYNGYMSDLRVVIGSTPYTANFTPPTSALTAITNTAFLLNFNNVNIFDGSRQKGVMRLFGNTTPSATQTKYAARSVYFDGTGDWIHIQANNNLEPMGGDFTYEWWWYPTTVSQRQWFFHSATDYWLGVDFQSDGKGLGIWASSTGSSWNLINSDPGGNGISNTVPSLNTWHHIAYVRNGSTFTLYLDGTSIVSVTGITAAIVDRSSETKVFGSWAMTNHQYPIVGYIEDIRFTKGLARYTSAFTPPTSELLG